jgi:hypothetical protein
MANHRPTRVQLRRVFEWLEEHGMAVYGPFIDRKTGNLKNGGRLDYTVTDAVKRYESICRERKEKQND